jgi:hypothetical protein
MVMIFIELNGIFICYAVGLLQYSKNVWSKVGKYFDFVLLFFFFSQFVFI